MTIHITNAQSIGNLVVEGKHKPFRALACTLRSDFRDSDFSQILSVEHSSGSLGREA